MLTGIVLHLIMAGNVSTALSVDLQVAPALRPLDCVIALKGRSAPGPDHGDDPSDEQHDGDLPANAHRHDGLPSHDPYNGSTKNGKQPWLDPPD
jgi:hypothetical protein